MHSAFVSVFFHLFGFVVFFITLRGRSSTRVRRAVVLWKIKCYVFYSDVIPIYLFIYKYIENAEVWKDAT